MCQTGRCIASSLNLVLPWQVVSAGNPCAQGFTAAHPGFNATDLFVEDGIYKWDNSLYAGAATCSSPPPSV